VELSGGEEEEGVRVLEIDASIVCMWYAGAERGGRVATIADETIKNAARGVTD